MSCEATLYFKSGTLHDGSAPSSLDSEGKFVFGRNFPRMVDILDDSAIELGVTKPSRFVWENPLNDEGELNKLSDKEFQELERKCNAMAKWIPIDLGIQTFKALASRYKLSPKEGTPTEREYFLAFEVACYHASLVEAANRGEQKFHIQCY